MKDYICGTKFAEMADFIFTPENKASDDYYDFPNTFKVENLKDENIVYTSTMYVKELFSLIEPLPNRFTVITHNSDINIDASFTMPLNVIKWHAQNVNVDHPRIESIPIGLENDIWFANLQKKDKMRRILTRHKSCRNWTYLNVNVKNNESARQLLYDLFEKEIWVDSDKGVNGKDFDPYLENIYNHRYVFCPEGNGLDTHRFWECLYMGSIPIVKKNINNWFYDDLPVLYVNCWEEVTQELLADMWSLYKDGEWNKDKLTFEYWKKWIATPHIS